MSVLIIVESPGKIKKISSILGSTYRILASVGHITDLDESSLSIDILENNKGFSFIPRYKVKKDRRDVVSNLKNAVKNVTKVIIATDADREGEAIGDAITNVLKLKNPDRIVFHEITKGALTKALTNPGKIDENMVRSQKARRVMDRLVGYTISPLLGDKKSVGRVQSVVLKLLTERQKEVEATTCTTSLTMLGDFSKDIKKARCKTVLEYQKPEEALQWLLDQDLIYRITDIKLTEDFKNPSPPFITSTLQQEAWNKLHYEAEKTMKLAQKLYEKGLITYHRTDCTMMSQDGQENIAEYIVNHFGVIYKHSRNWESCTKSQDAHECIRPTDVNVITSEDGFGCNSEEVSLYNLIWIRSVASQMSPVKYQIQTIQLANSQNILWEASRSNIIFEGFFICTNHSNKLDDNFIPTVNKGDRVTLVELNLSEHLKSVSRPYTESTLIHKLDISGVGRPSTYASILSLLKSRGCIDVQDFHGIPIQLKTIKANTKDRVIKESHHRLNAGEQKRALLLTHKGTEIEAFVQQHFPCLLDIAFTAQLEEHLDEIAKGHKDWQMVISNLYSGFYPKVVELRNSIIPRGNDLLGIDTGGCKYSIFDGKYGLAVKKDYPLGNGKYTSVFVKIVTPPSNLEEAENICKDTKYLGLYYNKPIFCIKGQFGCYVKYGNKRISIKTDDINKVEFEAVKKLVR